MKIDKPVSAFGTKHLLLHEKNMNYKNGNYRLSDDRTDIQFDQVVALLRLSYWAKERPVDTIKQSIDNSVCFGLFYQNVQVGFARVVTDFASVAYIADLIIHPDHRGAGIGKWMFEIIHCDARWRTKFQFLVTDDAHGLYEKFGFSGSNKLMSTEV
ncbi:acetyltransferase [Catenovulum agarivorans DS-2]|uniref:Acetyltransferase n=1 Tax=Catenovulum agarivorans DS-2 TaxID=1328313 RepID=W7Q9S4_9ALTE|nr:GNAT family N-acetyltransferase [Catenovulum agarivorans]EWH09559.1 acetyltransferase [Catenovulum agarivorans DS-2]